MHTVTNFIKEFVSLDTTSEENKSKALKVMFSIGLLRGSLPNLLSVVNLLRKHYIVTIYSY